MSRDSKGATPPTKDDIAVQHRPENAQSRHSALHRTEADGRKRGGDPGGGPKPDDEEMEADPTHQARTAVDPVSRRLEVDAPPPGLDPELRAKIRRIETLADWLDTKFTLPVINWPIGLDGIIGLIPGIGDTVTAGLSGYLIYEAYNSGARKRTLAQMGWNAGLDWLLGSIPLVGDVFDVAHKANAKNARLLLEELRRREAHGPAPATAAEQRIA